MWMSRSRNICQKWPDRLVAVAGKVRNLLACVLGAMTQASSADIMIASIELVVLANKCKARRLYPWVDNCRLFTLAILNLQNRQLLDVSANLRPPSVIVKPPHTGSQATVTTNMI